MKGLALVLAGGLVFSGCGGSTTEENNQIEDCALLEATDLSGNVTLEEGCYEVNSSVTLSGNLVLEAGVQMFFGSDAGIRVPNGSTLAAEGTAEKTVLLTGSRSERAYWQGIYFDNSNSAENRLDHVELEFAGSKKWSGAELSVAAVYLTGESRVRITNSRFFDNGGPAINIDGSVMNTSALVENTEFEKNTLPVMTRVQAIGWLGEGLVFTDNDKQEISIHTSSNTGAGEIQWRNHGIPYAFQGGLVVEGALTLESGTELVFPTDQGVRVTTDASLSAVGTEESVITFRGAEDPRGFWKGIYFEETASPLNSLDHVLIDGAGGAKWTGAEHSRGGVYVTGTNARLQIANTTVRNSAYAAINVDSEGVVTIASTSMVSNDSAILTRAPGLSNLSADLVFEDNDGYAVQIRTQSELETPATLHLYSEPYRVLDTLEVNAALEIEAGVEIQFNQSQGLDVNGAGRLIAVGTAESPIILQGTEDVVGFWKGIQLADALSSDNVLSHAQINGGGSNGWTGAPRSAANLYVEAASITLSNVSITKSGRHGITVETAGVVTSCEGVTFDANVDANVFAVESAVPNVACSIL